MKNFLKAGALIFLGWHGIGMAEDLMIDPAFIPLLSSENILNIVRRQSEVSLVEQLGEVLFIRDYLSTYIIIQTVLGSSNERPTAAPNGYSLDTGQWVWLPVGSGQWNFIERDFTRYFLFMQEYFATFFASL